jgi:hypothetical protein
MADENTGDTPERAREKQAHEHEAEERATESHADVDRDVTADRSEKEESTLESVPAARANKPTG